MDAAKIRRDIDANSVVGHKPEAGHPAKESPRPEN